MIHRITSIFCLLLASYSTTTIAQTGRYEKAIFDDVTVYEDVVYEHAIPYSIVGKANVQPYTLDFYEPTDDASIQRPLVLLFSDGGFVFGNKRQSDMVRWCDSLARYGYACACVDYRQGFDAMSSQSMTRAIYRAVQDARAAVRYFKAHQITFRIDTSQIYIGGKRAGAIVALHTAFLDKEAERPASTFGTTEEQENLGCLDCSGNPYEFVSEIAGVINVGGALYKTNYIEAKEPIPVVHIHKKNDKVIPIKTGHPFQSGFSNTFPLVYGSETLHQHMDSLGHYTEFYPYEEQEEIYGFANAGMTSYAILRQITTFLTKIMTFQSPIPNGDYSACEDGISEFYVPEKTGVEYFWEIGGGHITENNNHKIRVRWHSIGTGTVRVTEKSASQFVGRPSDKLLVKINPRPVPDYDLEYISENTILFRDKSLDGNLFTLEYGEDYQSYTNKTGNYTAYTYQESGQYLLTHTVENGCGFIETPISIEVEVPSSDVATQLNQAIKLKAATIQRGENAYIAIDQVEAITTLQISIMDINKQKLVEEKYNASQGIETIELDTQKLNEGIYFVQFETDDFTLSRKLVIDD